MIHTQWRIRDFADGDFNPKDGKANIYVNHIMPKLHESELNWVP